MELKSCPFCDGKAEFNQTEDGGHFIECTKCGSSTILRYSLMDDARPILAESWNYRAQLAAPVAEQKRGEAIYFMGVDPLNIPGNPVLPMIPDSWRFGFYRSAGGLLRFGYQDNGPLVAWDAVKDLIAPRQMTLTQDENMTLDLMIANINDELKDALVADDRESDVEILQARYSLLRKLSQLAAPSALECLSTVNTLGGFKGGFAGLHRRAPTEQEIWNAGVRSGLDRAAPQGEGK